MEKFVINGGNPLSGIVEIGGSKNAALPILAATLLSETPSIIRNIPDLLDVNTMILVLQGLGVRIEKLAEGTYQIFPDSLIKSDAPYELIRKMRASFLVTGPLITRLKRAQVPLPGGCAIGSRPIDLHIKGFLHLGVQVSMHSGYVEAWTDQLHPGEIYLDFPSVGATENIMMLASVIPGDTVIANAAREPEVTDLANFLMAMGAKIDGVGTDTIIIHGTPKLYGCDYSIINDRIEAGTFCVAAAITGGNVEVKGVNHIAMRSIITKLEEIGAKISKVSEDSLFISMKERPQATDIKTMPYPGFPTDMQAQFMTLLCLADGVSVITETVFENRFAHVGELERMGVNIKVEGRSAVVVGVEKLTGTQVTASDLRAGAALVLAGLAAEGTTDVYGISHVDRGYANLEKKLLKLGASIKRVYE
ncbi:MAG TPA: UDP-N-acetylglucosamine 1-carboxyvinyltransferase [Atribacter sp.]|uniref:UDP-N-acetylglucosamine 1-carboxyvinyltransferase n=1 Tax=Atribacter sp. TaxID=2847780 RepID=UPI002C941899|nr:UDP-N-acetylglucosamine 1-carboxyvinyltransferase [Atribacter sp.]MDD3713381.1 UDP-N-acetylglucosamine 1-carboxyvinyltransferase [Atribacterota bacterium]MDI9594281.1 UDP-N-acetylglucosamine 1-carboxyvinyltransferase [Atribacterota bacterium]HQK82429.1 UDP-N-acetylglucosamine 1-carboxyvinyltransferase [Atribacter sp.]